MARGWAWDAFLVPEAYTDFIFVAVAEVGDAGSAGGVDRLHMLITRLSGYPQG